MGLASTRLPGGYVLMTGQIFEAEDRLTKVSERALFWSLLLGLVMTGLIMFFQEYLLAQRIGDFVQTADAIQQGDLTRRVERNQTGDAFDRLGNSTNAMLARIEGLVAELRIMTDVMAHDLRSPVSRLKAGLERAISQTRDETAKAALGEAIGEADRLDQMLNTALQISRAEAGVGRDQFSRFPVDQLLRDAAEVYGPAAEDRGFVITDDFPARIFVRGHRDLLMQAISNLIDNALNHAAGGNAIRIEAAQEDGFVAITVADNGPGIPPAQRAEALKRFGRLDAARGTSGAGLGLSLVETIAHMHDGTLELSTEQGGGLCAVLRLAIAD
jgi:signal transduction histidine kinase